MAPSSHGKDDDDDSGTSSAATALIVVACLASAAVGLALLYVFWTKRRGGFQNLRTAFAPLPGTPSAFDSPFGGAAWSQPETPGVSNAPPSFEDHVANPMRGGYEAPGIEDPEASVPSSPSPLCTMRSRLTRVLRGFCVPSGVRRQRAA